MIIKVLKIVFVLMCIGSLVGFIWVTDLSLVLSQIQGIGLGFLGLLVLSALAHLCATIAWKVCFSERNEISLFSLFIIRVIGENITLFNPTNIVAGEASKYHLLKRFEVQKRESVNSILFSRIILIASNLLLILFCLFWIAGELDFYFELLLTLGFVLLVFFGIGFIIKYTRSNFKNRVRTKQNFRKLSMLTIYARRSVYAFLRFSRLKPVAFSTAFLFSLFHWMLGAGEIYLILECLEMPIGLLKSTVVDMGVVVAKSIGSFIPGQIGVEELGNKWMLEIAGVTGSVWVAVSIIRRGKQLVWILISTLLYFFIRNYSSIKKEPNGNLIYNT